MAGVKEKLLEFIQREAAGDEAAELQVIKKYSFESIFPERNREAGWKQRVNMQSLKYSIFAMELEKIASAFRDVILVKGLWYQDKFYEHQIRFCRDVDLFVRNEDFAQFDEIMRENNFIRLYENCSMSNKYYYFNDVYDNTELTIDKMNHFVYEKKELEWLKVEVHTFLLPFYRYPAVQYQEMYNRRKKIMLRVFLNISVLDCNDDFIYAACHMCKHLVNAIVRYEESVQEKETVLNGKLVYDLALMADVELLNTEQGKLYSAWDEMYWYIQYNPASKKRMTLYISVVCPLYDIHAVTFFVEKDNGLKVVTRGMKFAHQESPKWLKGVQAELGAEGQYMLKIAYNTLQIDPIKTKYIGCQIGIMIFGEGDEVVERMSLFGKGYYHFYDMGILSCGGGHL